MDVNGFCSWPTDRPMVQMVWRCCWNGSSFSLAAVWQIHLSLTVNPTVNPSVDIQNIEAETAWDSVALKKSSNKALSWWQGFAPLQGLTNSSQFPNCQMSSGNFPILQSHGKLAMFNPFQTILQFRTVVHSPMNRKCYEVFLGKSSCKSRSWIVGPSYRWWLPFYPYIYNHIM